MIYFDEYSDVCVINKTDIDSFYANLNNIDFSKITTKKLINLKLAAKDLRKFYNAILQKQNKSIAYTKLMNRIKTNPKGYGIETEAEKYILFMLTVDPNFEIFKIYQEFNKMDEIKINITYKFGIFDKNIILVEKYFIKYFLSKEKKQEIYEEADNRTFEGIKKK